MNYRVIAPILLGIAVAALCSAIELPATAYIDVNNVIPFFEKYLLIFAQLIENHSGETMDETQEMLTNVSTQLDMQIKGSSPTANPEYKEISCLDGRQSERLLAVLEDINSLIGAPQNQGDHMGWNLFFGTIKVVFGRNLNEFASGHPNHHPKLLAFLRAYIERILSANLPTNFDVDMSDDRIEGGLERLIAHDLKSAYTIDDLISRAQSLDLVKDKFDAKSMLESYEKLYGQFNEDDKPSERLSLLLNRICYQLSHLLGQEFEIYNWARLLLKGGTLPEPSSNFLKMMEFWRFCSPAINRNKEDSVIKNIRDNMGDQPAPNNSIELEHGQTSG